MYKVIVVITIFCCLLFGCNSTNFKKTDLTKAYRHKPSAKLPDRDLQLQDAAQQIKDHGFVLELKAGDHVPLNLMLHSEYLMLDDSAEKPVFIAKKPLYIYSGPRGLEFYRDPDGSDRMKGAIGVNYSLTKEKSPQGQIDLSLGLQ